jgi:chromate transporter
LATVLRDWGRIGCLGFGGPPTHIAMLRKLCVDDRAWLDAREFEDAVAACNLLPGPASTQLAIFTAWRVAGRAGAVVGGLGFILPGLVAIVLLSWLFLAGSPPDFVLGAGAGAGAAVAAVAVQAGLSLVPGSRKRSKSLPAWIAYAVLGGIAGATLGSWLVLVLLGCGLAEVARQRLAGGGALTLLAAAPATGGLGALAWLALKVGLFSYGGGFVIVPLMQGDAVSHHWVTHTQFLNAVALGQITPGPVVHTVTAIGFAAAGVGGAVLAAVVAFTPSFAFVLLGGSHFEALRKSRVASAFLDGAGPAAIGAIFGSSIPLSRALTESWQWAVLAGAAVLLLALRRGVVTTLLLAGAVGAVVVAAGASA